MPVANLQFSKLRWAPGATAVANTFSQRERALFDYALGLIRTNLDHVANCENELQYATDRNEYQAKYGAAVAATLEKITAIQYVVDRIIWPRVRRAIYSYNQLNSIE